MATATPGLPAGAAASTSSSDSVAAKLAAPRAQMTGLVFALVTATALLVSFSESMLIPALPTIQEQYNASAAAVSWVPAIYLLVGAVSVPLFGKLGDLYGKKRMLIVVMSAYSLAVVLDGFSWSLESLLAFRAIQGLGLAMFPLVLSMIQDQMPASRVPVSVGVVSAMNGVGAAIGLIGGAAITQAYGWQANYHLLAPFAVGLTVSLAVLARESPRHSGESIDVTGITLLGLTVTFLLIGISEGGVLGWTSPASLTLFGLAAVFGVAFALIERRIHDPLMAVRSPTFSEAIRVNLATLLAGGTLFIGFYVVIYFAQEPTVGLGRDVSQAALILAPAAILMLLFAPLGGRIAQRRGTRIVDLLGFLLVAVGFAVIIVLHATAWQLAVGSVILFAGVSFLLTALSISVLVLSPPAKVGTEVGLNTSFRTIGQAVGVAISGAFLASYVFPGTELPTDLAYGYTAIVGIVMGILGLLIAATLPTLKVPEGGSAAVG